MVVIVLSMVRWLIRPLSLAWLELGERWVELNALPQRGPGYSRPMGPPILTCISQMVAFAGAATTQ